MNKKSKLKRERLKIDKVDKKIFNLIKERTNIVNRMLLLKDTKRQIVDKKRIIQILKRIRKKSLINKIDPKITSQIWKSMIWSYVKYQKKNFVKK